MDSRLTRIHRLLEDPYTKLNCLFLQAAIPVFDTVNTVLQSDKPCIHILHSVLLDLLQSVLVRFIKPASITSAATLTAVQFKDKEHQKSDDDITVGSAAREFILKNSVAMASRLPQFYASVRQYYVNACTYMISKFPFHDPVLLNAEVANIGTRDQQSVKKLMFFVERYSCLLPPSATIDSLEEQFNNYQIASLPEAVKNAERIDEAWHEIGHIPDVATGLPKFGLLSSAVKGILVTVPQ